MKNRYPKPCSVCQGTVPTGEGTLRRVGTGWTVTHDDACPRDAIHQGHARAHTRRVLGVLNSTNVTRQEIAVAVEDLGELIRTRWTTRESCEKALLSAKAFTDMDRMEVEEILQAFLPQASHC